MTHFRTKDGCSLYYETHGSNVSTRNLVFLNGTMQSTLLWLPQARFFKDRFSVLLFDGRGQGQSDLGTSALSPDLHTADLAQLLKHLGIERASLVGLSHGAAVALSFVLRAPESVDRLIVCSVGAGPSTRSKAVVESWLRILEHGGLEAMAWASIPMVFGEEFLKQRKNVLHTLVKGIVARNSEKALIAHLKAMSAYPPPAQWVRGLHTPCLVISGSEDPLVTKEEAERLAALCGGTHLQIDGAGHSVAIEAPDVFNRSVMAFLEEA